MEKSVNTHNRQRYFLTNKMFFLRVMYRYVHMIFSVKCVIITSFFIVYAALWRKSKIFIVLSSFETVHDTAQYRYCIFSLLYRLLRIKLKRQNPLFSYVREIEKVHCNCTMYCTLHFIINLFNVGTVLLCVICQLHFTVFMYVTRISRYITLCIAFCIIRGFT